MKKYLVSLDYKIIEAAKKRLVESWEENIVVEYAGGEIEALKRVLDDKGIDAYEIRTLEDEKSNNTLSLKGRAGGLNYRVGEHEYMVEGLISVHPIGEALKIDLPLK